MTTLAIPTVSLSNPADSASAQSQPLSRRRGLSVTNPADDHADSPAKKGPGANLFNFGGSSAAKPPTLSTLPTMASGSTSPNAFGAAPSGILGGSLPPTSSSATSAGSSGAPAPPTSTPFGGFSFPPKPAASTPFGGASAAPAASGGGLFGSTTTSAAPASSGGGLFGGGASSAAPTSGGGLFGSATTSAPAASGGLFGASASTAVGNSNPFGGSMTGTSAPGGGGGVAFGSASVPSGGLFGSSNAFGTSTNTTQTPSLFNSTASAFGGQPQTMAQSQFGASTTTQTASPFRTLAASQAQKPEVRMEDRIGSVKNAWDRGHPSCRFQYFFYNVVPREQVHFYARPPLAQNEYAWQNAVRMNPDPSRMVPVLAVGFTDLKRRAGAQEVQAVQHQAKLEELSASLTKLARKHTVETTARLHKLQSQQTHLLSRLMHLISQLQPLTSLSKSSIRPDEEALARRLAELKGAVDGRVAASQGGQGKRGQGRGQGAMGKARLGELWALLGQVKAVMGERSREDGGWAVVDEAELNKVLSVLSQQQAGLDHLVRTLKKMNAELDVMRASFGLPTSRPREDEP